MNLFKKQKTELSYVIFEVTPKCNLNCLYCYNHWKRPGEPTPSEVSYTTAQKVLSTLFKQTTLKHITFSGGEPLLFERLQELILFCRMKGASVSVITNGNSGSAEYYASLMRIGVHLFELPIHSFEASAHDRMTQTIGSWEKSVHSIRLIQNMGGTVVPVIVVTKYNFNLIGKTLEFIHSMGLRRVMINRYNIGGTMSASPEKIMPTATELREAFQQANEAVLAFNMEISSNVCTPHCVVNPKNFRKIAFTNCSADLMNRPLTVTASGDLRFCNHSPSVLGNVTETPISKILEKAQLEMGEFNVPDFCSDCKLYEKCLGGCRAAAEQIVGTLCEVDPIVHQDSKQQKEQTA
jgi:radical SAM protein with 4Fe4S-binding SPASM domain